MNSDIHIVALGVVESTMAEARQRVEDGDLPLPFVVLAEAQSTGIGRQGRAWISNSEAGLYATFALTLTLPPERTGLIAIATGVAIADVLSEAGADPRLKWPNDILIGDRKLAGILIQSFGADPRVFLIGIGINLESSPALDDAGGIALDSLLDVPIERTRLVRPLASAVGNWLDLLVAGDVDTIIDAWIGYALHLGQEITLVTEAGAVQGISSGIDATGRLLISTANGDRAFAAGDVIVGPRT